MIVPTFDRYYRPAVDANGHQHNRRTCSGRSHCFRKDQLAVLGGMAAGKQAMMGRSRTDRACGGPIETPAAAAVAAAATTTASSNAMNRPRQIILILIVVVVVLSSIDRFAAHSRHESPRRDAVANGIAGPSYWTTGRTTSPTTARSWRPHSTAAAFAFASILSDPIVVEPVILVGPRQ
jgi:hypothetical protein